ncbi:hypothetical protein [Lacrimispora brassicae]
MSKKIKDEYTELLCECERSQTSKLWKSYQQYVLQLKTESNLDREDTLILVNGLAKLGLYKQAFGIIESLDNRNHKENKIWYELKVNSEQTGDNLKVFKYLTSKKFDIDRIATKPFRDKVTKEFQQAKIKQK